VDVDEPGRDHVAADVDLALGLRAVQLPDLGDPSVPNRDARRVGRRPEPSTTLPFRRRTSNCVTS
jgi:hypothetical protein